MSPARSSSRIHAAVGASTDPKGSSSSSSSALGLYAARARATRAFWPPDKLMPRAPMKASSPPGSNFKSLSNPDALTAFE
eukprot:Skav222432  [mRNA]  locus=scaffold2883:30494:31873:+ [translate_table: standard]